MIEGDVRKGDVWTSLNRIFEG